MPNKMDYEKRRDKYIKEAALWNKNNKDKVSAVRRKIRESRRAWLDGLKSGPCVDCGNFYHPCVMDFDHVRGDKFRNLAAMSGFPETVILDEIAKCDLVCANCHRMRTHRRKAVK